MWVFIYKTDKHGMLQRCKAKLVVCGNQQEPGNLPTKATTLAATSFRTLMVIMAKFDLEIIQLDAINAFVNVNLNELVYMRTSLGFPVKNHVLRLNRAFYGLRRSSLLWQKELLRALATCGFTAIPQEPCILIKGSVVAFYFVDNIMFCYRKSAQAEAKGAVENLKTRFEITDLGEIKWFLGLYVLRDRQKRLLWLSQKAYVKKVAERFGLAGHISRQLFTLIPAKKLHLSAEIPITSFRNLFQKKMESVLYAAMQTRCYGLVAEGRHHCARPMPLASARTRARARPNPASPLGSGSVSTLADSFRRVPRDLVVIFPFFFTNLI
jgi:hypothetical protein